MKKILVIDDLRTFKFPAEYARHLMHGWALLNDGQPWDELWLDFDLGVFEGRKEDTYFIAVGMEEKAYHGNPIEVNEVVIHTSNPEGRRRLTAGLERYYNVRQVYLEREDMVSSDG